MKFKKGHRNPGLMLKMTLVVCFLPLLWSCDYLDRSQKKPKVVRKKILAQKSVRQQTKKVVRPKKINISKKKSDLGATKSLTSVFGLDKKMKPSLAKDLYNPKGKIDPFLPLFREDPLAKAAAAEKKRRQRPLTPLEKLDLSQLRLVGIIRAPTGNKALVQEASGKGYIIIKGTRLGRNSGQVVQILKSKVIVEEEVENVLGKMTLRKKELNLQKPPGER